jgi:hypothetical protein
MQNRSWPRIFFIPQRVGPNEVGIAQGRAEGHEVANPASEG